jgi:pimeloyl-ACP methyl ester carboxylesterase
MGDRRGRGDSGDTKPYAVEREIEDIEVLIDEVGGSAALYGISSGAVLALDAASHLPTKVSRVALYEPPFIVDDSHAPLPDDYVAQLDAATAAGRPGDAVEIFMTKAMGIPPAYVASMKTQPSWPDLEQVAHTIAYDGRVMGDTMRGQPLPIDRWSSHTPTTLVITGSQSEPMFASAARSLVERLPDAKHRMLEGQSHNVAPEALTPLLREFFATA